MRDLGVAQTVNWRNCSVNCAFWRTPAKPAKGANQFLELNHNASHGVAEDNRPRRSMCLAECGRPRLPSSVAASRHAQAGRIVRTPLAFPAFLRSRTGALR